MNYDPVNKKQEELIKLLKDNNINTDMGKRCDEGTPHNPKSTELMTKVADLDWLLLGDHFEWKTGRSGDDGETMMYLFDVVFDLQDKLSADNVPEKALNINDHWYYTLESPHPDESDPYVYFVRKTYWHEEGFVDEDILEDVEKGLIIIPHGFSEVMEAAYGPYNMWSLEETITIVEKWGFVKAPESN